MAQNYTNLHEFFDGDIIQRMIEMSIHIGRIVKLAELDLDWLKINFIILIYVKKLVYFEGHIFHHTQNLKACLFITTLVTRLDTRLLSTLYLRLISVGCISDLLRASGGTIFLFKISPPDTRTGLDF